MWCGNIKLYSISTIICKFYNYYKYILNVIILKKPGIFVLLYCYHKLVIVLIYTTINKRFYLKPWLIGISLITRDLEFYRLT